MNKAMFNSFICLIVIESITLHVYAQQAIWGKSPVQQPYDYVSKGSFIEIPVSLSSSENRSNTFLNCSRISV